MKKQKTVFSASELFHVFISQSQVEGKTPLKTPSRGYSFASASNDSWGNYASYRQAMFQGKKIWSYGSHYLMGELHNENKILLINSEKSSNTTQGHKIDLEAAAKHLDVYYVPHVDDPKNTANLEYLREQVFNAFNDILSKISGFTPYNTENDYKAAYNYKSFIKAYNSLNNYVKAFKLPKEAILDSDTQDLIKEVFLYMGQKEVLRREKRRLQDIEKAENREKHRQELRKLNFYKNLRRAVNWRKGLRAFPPSYFPTMLRIYKNRVETSHGAAVDLKDAILLYKLILKGKDIKGLRIGHYTCKGYDTNEVVIGCHNIQLKEIERVLSSKINQLKLIKGA